MWRINISHFKSLFKITLFVSYPFFVVVFLGYFLMPYLSGYIREVVAFGFLELILLSLLFLISNKKLRRHLIVYSTLLLAFLAFVKLSFYYHYDAKISASALFVIFETNALEASEFASNYFNLDVFCLFGIAFIPVFFFLFYLKRYKSDSNFLNQNTPENSLCKLLFILTICASIYTINKRFKSENILVASYNSYGDYKKTKAILKESLAQPTSPNIEVTDFKTDAQTYVVIIGESTSRWHMQLYGYDRETNPLLSEIKKELTVFENVISPHVHTITALEKIVTLSHFYDKNKKDNASIVQLANQAGFSTYWISNQRPVGINESIPTLIGSAAKETYFLNTEDYSSEFYDSNVLPVLNNVLENEVNKKIVFIHLMGAHVAYKRRYPKAYNYFTAQKENAKFKHNRAFKFINEYDNALRYNDFIVRSIIESVRSKGTKSYVMYFSDHGDEVYDTMDLVGHNEYHGTKPMYEIPFLVWLSDSYKKEASYNIENNTKKPYLLEDFIHSFSDLSRINFNKLDSTKSIFSPHFKIKKRIVRNEIDYDEKR